MKEPVKSRRGFAAMSPEKQREIARKGGAAVPANRRSFFQDRKLAVKAGREGGKNSGGNFEHDRERAASAGRKGGKKSPGNFARDPKRASLLGRKGGMASRPIVAEKPE